MRAMMLIMSVLVGASAFLSPSPRLVVPHCRAVGCCSRRATHSTIAMAEKEGKKVKVLSTPDISAAEEKVKKMIKDEQDRLAESEAAARRDEVAKKSSLSVVEDEAVNVVASLATLAISLGLAAVDVTVTAALDAGAAGVAKAQEEAKKNNDKRAAVSSDRPAERREPPWWNLSGRAVYAIETWANGVVDGVKQKLAGSPVWLLQQVGRLLFWGASGVFQLTKDKLEEWKEEQRQIKIAEAVRVARIAQLKEKELALKREDAAREALAAQEAAGAIAIAMAREKAIARGEIEPPTFLKTVANGFRAKVKASLQNASPFK